MKIFNHSKILENLPQQFFARLVKDVSRVTSEGHDVINLAQGNPDKPTPEHIVLSAQEAVSNPLFHKYPPFRGYSFLKEAAAEFYKREYNVDIDPETEVAVLFGGKAGLIEVSQCLLDEGDTALVPDPGYPDYWSGIALANARMEPMPLLAKNRYLPDYNNIDKGTLDQAKLMFLNYPNNPTGAIATTDFFSETVELAEAHGFCVVHDLAYGAIGFDGEKPVSYLQTPRAKDVGIEIYTLSKTYNMAGWRVGFAVGNPSVIEALNLLQDHLHVSLFGGVQEAAATALASSQECVDELVSLYESRRNFLIERLKEIGWDVEPPKGSFFAWLPVPDGYTSESLFKKLLEEAHVAVAPGIGFGDYGEGYVRVGLLQEEEVLAEAVRRIGKLGLFK
ncbi:pyridoxal phosphate-dependent aminotransferase [Bacillus salacetis]|uniref:Pyridoxal phosphate-dependent aminotransferase n=1 Tax=Bacillus salacetis TaxID=2315464 RepID=A0A3A1R633_9BACI|nr:pyridoxal phosphate-dependent aminotransferase [Bacillus salacetis]RIW38288.1 pyridoxal phosphate-dependent aminotransferase [Bacillus salacetis]